MEPSLYGCARSDSAPVAQTVVFSKWSIKLLPNHFLADLLGNYYLGKAAGIGRRYGCWTCQPDRRLR
jgi:hypothetical protein